MISHILLGFGVSFVGSLPLGVLNLTAIEVAVSKRFYHVLLFALGVIIIEFLQAYVALSFSEYIMSNPSIESAIQRLVIPLFLIVGILYLRSGRKKRKAKAKGVPTRKENISKRPVPPFMKGILLSIINPLAIPYWLAIATSLKGAGQLIFEQKYIILFIIGIVMGTYTALVMYGALGEILEKKLKKYEVYFNSIIGIILISLAVIQFYRVFIQ